MILFIVPALLLLLSGRTTSAGAVDATVEEEKSYELKDHAAKRSGSSLRKLSYYHHSSDDGWHSSGWCTYACPELSEKIVEGCPTSFKDCACKGGYFKSPYEQKCKKWCGYECPKYSYEIPGKDCYDSFDDCKCIDGYMKEGNQCVPLVCKTCPENSHPDTDCVIDFWKDCKCDKGYYKEKGKCVQWCGYTCPEYSYEIPGRDCYDNFDDCKCIDGYMKKGGQCVPQTCQTCPENSHANTECVIDFWKDCDCEKGYHKENGQCVQWCGYTCPRRSYPNPNKSCTRSINDCVCYDGFEMVNGSCQRERCDFQCPANSTPKTNCPKDFWSGCKCDKGYYPENGKCAKWCDYDCESRRAYTNPHLECHTTFDHCVCWRGYVKSQYGDYCTKPTRTRKKQIL